MLEERGQAREVEGLSGRSDTSQTTPLRSCREDTVHMVPEWGVELRRCGRQGQWAGTWRAGAMWRRGGELSPGTQKFWE